MTDDATRAELLRRRLEAEELRRGTPEHGVTHAGGITGFATQGALANFGDEYLAGLSAILGVQPDGQGGANWFDYSQPLRERYDTALGQIRSELGEYQSENPALATTAQVAGAVGTAVPLAAVAAPARATTTAGQVGQLVTAGAVGGAVDGYGAGEGGVGNRLRSAAQGGAIGAVAAPLIGYPIAAIGRAAERIYGRVARQVFEDRRFFDANTGQLTEAGQRAIRNLGLEPQDMTQELQRALGQTLEGLPGTDAPTREAAERLALGSRFEVPLTRGQATGDVAQTAAEENFRAGTRGQSAYNAITEFDNAQGAAVERARVGVLPRNAEADRISAAEGVISGVRRMADDARSAGNAAYTALENAGAAIDGSAVNNLAGRIDNAVRMSGGVIDESTPNAQSALGMLGRLMQGGDQGSVPFMNIERARQNLLRVNRAAQSGSNGADQVAMQQVIEQFDNWMDDTITTALQQGDEGVLAQAREARELWSRYRSTFLGRDGPANLIRRIVEDELTPDQVAAWMLGASRNMGGGATSSLTRRLRDILGADSPEFNAIRVAAWDQATSAPEGARQFGPARIAANISEMLDGRGQTLSRELYSEAQIRQMREFMRLMRTLEPPPRSTNPSGTGYEVRRLAGEIRNAIFGLAGNAAGGPVVGLATQEGVDRTSNFVAGVQARAATRGIQTRPASMPAAVGVGVAAGSAMQDAGYVPPFLTNQRGPQ